MNLLLVILKIVGAGILYAIPMAICGHWLAATGRVRSQTWALIGFSIFFQLILQLMLLRSPSTPLIFWGVPLISIAATIGFYRNDFALYQKRGAWWWQKSEYQNEKTSPLALLFVILLAILVAGLVIGAILIPPSR